MFTVPCEEVIGLVDIEGREGGGIVEGVDIAFADNGTNGNVSTLHHEIEGVGVSSLLLNRMRSWLQPLAMEHLFPSIRILIEIPYQYKPEQGG